MSFLGILDFFGDLFTTNEQVNAAEDAQEREFAQQEKLLQMQNDFTRESWLMNNEYNKPVNQMQRLLDAGINPDAAAQSVAGGNSPTSMPVQSSQTPAVPSAISSIVDAFNGLKQDYLSRGFNRELLKAQTEGVNIENALKPIKNYREERYAAAFIEKAAAEKGLSEAQTRQIVELLPLYKDKTKAEIDMTNDMILKLRSEVDKIRKEIEVDDATIAKIMSDVKLNDAELDKISSEIAFNYAKVAETQGNTTLIGKQTETEAIKAAVLKLQQLASEFKDSYRANLGVDIDSSSFSILTQVLTNGFDAVIVGFKRLFGKMTREDMLQHEYLGNVGRD